MSVHDPLGGRRWASTGQSPTAACALSVDPARERVSNPTDTGRIAWCALVSHDALVYRDLVQPFDAIGEEYQRIHADNPFQRSAIADLLSRLPPRSSILDLGCGTGIPAAQSLVAAGHHVTGLDVSARMVELAKRQVPEGEFLQEDMLQARFDDGIFDAVVAYFSLLMLPKSDVAIMLDRIHGWLRSDGLLSLGMVNFDADALPVEFMGVPVRVTGYSPDGMAAALVRSELNVISLDTVEHQPLVGPVEPQIFCLAHKAATS